MSGHHFSCSRCPERQAEPVLPLPALPVLPGTSTVPALALPLGLFVAAPAAIAWAARPGWPRALVFAGGFVGFELLRGEILTGFPWNLMGSVWAFDALPIQMAALIGVHGLSLITLLVAATPLLDRRAFLGGFAALAFCGAFGFFTSSSWLLVKLFST